MFFLMWGVDFGLLLGGRKFTVSCFLEDYKVMMLYDYMVLVLCGLILRDKGG